MDEAEGRIITVIGSTNTDMVVVTETLPRPGETLLGGRFFMNAGGKGANQAVAASRLGGNVNFIAKTGNDVFGRQARELFNKEGIDTRSVFTDNETASGVALINVDNHGENCIAVAPGANDRLLRKTFNRLKNKFQKLILFCCSLKFRLIQLNMRSSSHMKPGKKLF
jgi:ribokinase